MPDYYDHRGRLLDGPDDPSAEACVQHGNNADTCAQCRANFEREEAEYRAFRAENPLIGDREEDAETFKDLPF
jgi:hypothetical protein